MISCLHKILSYLYGMTIAGLGITAVRIASPRVTCEYNNLRSARAHAGVESELITVHPRGVFLFFSEGSDFLQGLTA